MIINYCRHFIGIFWLIFSKKSLSKTTMFLAFGIFFNSIFNSNLTSWKILPVHLMHCEIWWCKIVKADKTMTFTCSILRISCYFCVDYHSKVTESLIEHFLIDLRIKISNKKIGSNILSSFILRSFIDFNWFTKQFNHMHNFDRVICIFFALKLNESVSLMLISNFISGKMNVNNRSTLNKKFP